LLLLIFDKIQPEIQWCINLWCILLNIIFKIFEHWHHNYIEPIERERFLLGRLWLQWRQVFAQIFASHVFDKSMGIWNGVLSWTAGCHDLIHLRVESFKLLLIAFKVFAWFWEKFLELSHYVSEVFLRRQNLCQLHVCKN